MKKINAYKKFTYKTVDELKADIEETGTSLPVSEGLDVLAAPVQLKGKTIFNRLIVHPMEGCDGETDGSPSELVSRRYKRFAKGGAALLWVEACAVSQESRANPRQLWLNQKNKDSFLRLVQSIHENSPTQPYLVLQLTHSGRYSKPGGGHPAVIAAENPYLDKFLPQVVHTITDYELEKLEDVFVESAKLAKECGFDGVDVKACHRYLNSELLSAFTRDGRYGGCFENRTRFMLNVVKKIKAQVDIEVVTRINAFDEIPYPYGWGVNENDCRVCDLTEMKRLSRLLWENGVSIINITGGNPYYNPHVNRPFDNGPYTPFVHPLDGISKLLYAAKAVKEAVPGMIVISTGYSWLREYGANVAAGCIEKGWFDMAGFGRQAFAYPDFAADILEGGMVRSKCCIACSKCSEIMRGGGKAGCVIKDSEIYFSIYKEATAKTIPRDSSIKSEHV